MTPEIERFVEAATRPLAGHPEARDEARTELMSRLSHQGVPLEMLDLSGPIERLEQAKVRQPLELGWTIELGILFADYLETALVR